MSDGLTIVTTEIVNSVVIEESVFPIMTGDVFSIIQQITGDGTNYQATPPTDSTATGTKGMYSLDDDWFYVCIATNTWKRLPMAGGF